MRNLSSCRRHSTKFPLGEQQSLLQKRQGHGLQLQSVVNIDRLSRAKILAYGNDRLLAWLNKVLLVDGLDAEQILDQLTVEEPRCRELILAKELLNQQTKALVDILSRVRVFELPVPEAAISAICTDVSEWKQHCQRAVALGLLEVSQFQAQTSYRIAHILEPLIPCLDTPSLVQKAAEVLYQLWWVQAEIVNQEQCLEIYRLAKLAGNGKMTLVIDATLRSHSKPLKRCGEERSLPLNVGGQGKCPPQTECLDVASSLNNLAFLYYSQGRYSEAEPLYVAVLKKRLRRLGGLHPDVASSLNNLAGLYESQGRYREAEPLYVKALRMRKRLLGERHPDVASSLNNLAGLYESQGRYSKAKLLYIEALEMRRRLLGERHPDVASSLNDLAGLYASQGSYSEAGAALC